MTEPSQRIVRGVFVAVLLLSVAGVAAQAAYDHLPKPPLVKREARVAFTAKPPKQEATVAAVTVIAATPIPTPTPEPTPEPTVIPTPVPTIVPTTAPVVVPVAIGSHSDWMAAAGIPESDWQYVDFIVKAESGWRVTVSNPSSGSYGLCQSLPANKMASAGSDFMSNPVTQLKWCNSYAHERYSGWYQAFLAWQRQKWW
jgi:hypothetical protein